jgi:uncharacterized OB-fold protein
MRRSDGIDEFVLADDVPIPVPRADGLDAPYWAATREERIVAQRCAHCLRFQWPAEFICHRCLARELTFEPVTGRGVVYSWERIWHATLPALRQVTPYVVLLVELPDADGIRMIGNLTDRTADVEIGQPVQPVFEHHSGAHPFTLVQWSPVPMA